MSSHEDRAIVWSVIGLLVVAALLNAAGWGWELFKMPGPYDEITHAFTIFAITLAFGVLAPGPLLTGLAGHPILFVLIIAALGIALGALWEVTEWVADKIVAAQVVKALDDTIIDLIMDSAGAVLAGLLSRWILRTKGRMQSAM